MAEPGQSSSEEYPYLILPSEITRLIQDIDNQSVGDKKSWIRDEKDKGGKRMCLRERKGKNKEREYWQVPQPVHLSTVLLFCAYIDSNSRVASCIPL
jgi:hypothetical protein